MITANDSEIKEEDYIDLSCREIRECRVNSSLLRQLDLSDNKLTSFEIRASNLENLNLSDNELTYFEIQAPKLENLNLFNNQLTGIKIEAPLLEILIVSCNRLTAFEIQALELEYLNLSENPLKILALDNSDVPRLRTLALVGTLVKFVDKSLFDIVKGTHIEERKHHLGLVDVIRGVFAIKGHPVAEEICDYIEE